MADPSYGVFPFRFRAVLRREVLDRAREDLAGRDLVAEILAEAREHARRVEAEASGVEQCKGRHGGCRNPTFADGLCWSCWVEDQRTVEAPGAP